MLLLLVPFVTAQWADFLDWEFLHTIWNIERVKEAKDGRFLIFEEFIDAQLPQNSDFELFV